MCETAVNSDAQYATQALRIFLSWDMDSYLSNYKGRVHVIAADHFLEIDDFNARYAKRITVDTMHNVGHFLMLEKPDAFPRQLNQFLNSIV